MRGNELIDSADFGRRDGYARKRRISAEQRLDLSLAFFRLERTGGIDEQAAGLHERCRPVEEP